MHPTRTNLLALKEKRRAVAGSIAILKARRKALMAEFLKSTKPFLKSRAGIRSQYSKALRELALSLGAEGERGLASVCAVGRREVYPEIIDGNILGVRYREVQEIGGLVRKPSERGYDYTAGSQHVEEAAYLFEKIVEEMLQVAAYENKIKMLAEKIRQVTRRMRVLEERLHPALREKIKRIGQYLGEREREEYFRLKRFKEMQTEKEAFSFREDAW